MKLTLSLATALLSLSVMGSALPMVGPNRNGPPGLSFVDKDGRPHLRPHAALNPAFSHGHGPAPDNEFPESDFSEMKKRAMPEDDVVFGEPDEEGFFTIMKRKLTAYTGIVGGDSVPGTKEGKGGITDKNGVYHPPQYGRGDWTHRMWLGRMGL